MVWGGQLVGMDDQEQFEPFYTVPALILFKLQKPILFVMLAVLHVAVCFSFLGEKLKQFKTYSFI